jgi:DNA modification methylase
MTPIVFHGDCVRVMRGMRPDSVDAIVTDPPYGLGFMGKAWDRVDGHELWAREALRVLKPGGHLLAFGGTRTYHRLACAIEDAGFEIRDSLHWLHGEGFPKGKNLDDEWQGWSTALKPSHEPIVLARKLLEERTVAKQVLVTGTGALNIGGTKVVNRWPPNVLLDDFAAQLLDEQSGDRPSGRRAEGIYAGFNDSPIFGAGEKTVLQALEASNGGASRFFPVFKYQAKANRKERGEANNHPTVKPLELMKWLVKLVTPPNGLVLDPFAGSGTTLLAAEQEGFRSVGIECDEGYVAILKTRILGVKVRRLRMKHDQAVEIIVTAKEAGVLVEAMPEVPEDRVALAESVVRQARNALTHGRDTPIVRTILRLAEMGNGADGATFAPDGDGPPPQGEVPQVQPLSDGVKTPEEAPQEAPEAPPMGTPYEAPPEARASVEARIAQLGLPAPPRVPDDAIPNMPMDLTAISDNELRRLHGAFDGMLAWAAYNLALEENDLQAAELLLSHKRGEVIEVIDKIDLTTGKAKLVTVVEAEADRDKDVVRWKAKAAHHKATVRLLKTQRDLYQGHIDRCSREWTMRQDSWAKQYGGQGKR